MKDLIVTPPEGYEVDKENSTFEKIVFKKIEKRWRDDETQRLNGYFIDLDSDIRTVNYFNTKKNNNVFATKKQAKSAIAMARISQIMANDLRFGGSVTDEEWNNETVPKFCIYRDCGTVMFRYPHKVSGYHFLAFHTFEQRKLFYEENEDLIKDYLMID